MSFPSQGWFKKILFFNDIMMILLSLGVGPVAHTSVAVHHTELAVSNCYFMHVT